MPASISSVKLGNALCKSQASEDVETSVDPVHQLVGKRWRRGVRGGWEGGGRRGWRLDQEPRDMVTGNTVFNCLRGKSRTRRGWKSRCSVRKRRTM